MPTNIKQQCFFIVRYLILLGPILLKHERKIVPKTVYRLNSQISGDARTFKNIMPLIALTIPYFALSLRQVFNCHISGRICITANEPIMKNIVTRMPIRCSGQSGSLPVRCDHASCLGNAGMPLAK